MDDLRTTTTLPNPQELLRKYGPYLSQTDTVPRPTEDDFGYIRDDQRRREAVTEARAQWDRADEYHAQLLKGVAERKAEREAAAQAEREARAAAQLESRQADRAALEDRLKREFLEQPGALPTDWTPELANRLITEHLIQQAGQADAAAREASLRRTRQAW